MTSNQDVVHPTTKVQESYLGFDDGPLHAYAHEEAHKPLILGSDNSTQDDDYNNHDPYTPTTHDLLTLPRVSAVLPASVFIIALVELCERFTFYGLSGPLQNYISNTRSGSAGNPGALGLGQAWASGLTAAFSCWCHLSGVLGAIMADQYCGKYRAIVAFAAIYGAGLAVLVASSTDASVDSGWRAVTGLLLSMAVIGLGTGGIKANVAPLIAEQVRDDTVRVSVEESTGKRVLIDPKLTVERIYMYFYLCVNVGSLSGIITTYMEHTTGYFSVFLLTFCFFLLGVVILVLGRNQYVVKPPRGSIISDSLRILYLTWTERHKNRGMDIAKPSIRNGLILSSVPWTDSDVDDVRQALRACRILLFFPFFWVTFFQMMSNFVSQAGTMELHGIPNDLLSNIDPIIIIIFIPVLNNCVYPWLRRLNFALAPTTRIALGFALAVLAMLYTAAVQHQIYSSPPCYTAPLACAAAQPSTSDGKVKHQQIHVLWQAPAYILVGLAEIFAAVTGYELAYTQAPSSMKSLVQSVLLVMTAAGAALSALVAPWARDPYLTKLFLALELVSGLSGVVFWKMCSRWDVEAGVRSKVENKGQDEGDILLQNMDRNRAISSG